MATSSDVKMRNMLDSITSTLQNGDDIDRVMAPSGDAYSEIEDVVDIIQFLHSSLTPRQPSEQFAADLRTDLLGGRRGMVERVSQIPARVHIAAILAVFAGCVLLMMRRLLGSDTAQEIQEEVVASPL